MIVAITGGTGFIGRRLVQRHVEAGDTVRLLTRRGRADVPFADRMQVITGDLACGHNSLAAFVDGAAVLYHCAGEIRNQQRMRAVHVEGTRRLVDAAKGRVGRWVQLSSAGAYGLHWNGLIDESTPTNPHGEYDQTKLESDRLVESAAAARAFEHVVLRPSTVIGLGMTGRLLSQMTAMIQRGLFFYIGPPGATVNGIHVDNVAEALVRCGTCTAAPGRVFNLSDCCPLETFVAAIADALGRPAPQLRLPRTPVRLAARVFGRLPGMPLTEFRVDVLCNRARYPSDRIQRELGYRHLVSMPEGVARFVASWRQRN